VFLYQDSIFMLFWNCVQIVMHTFSYSNTVHGNEPRGTKQIFFEEATAAWLTWLGGCKCICNIYTASPTSKKGRVPVHVPTLYNSIMRTDSHVVKKTPFYPSAGTVDKLYLQHIFKSRITILCQLILHWKL
jgi:hypothetical protein